MELLAEVRKACESFPFTFCFMILCAYLCVFPSLLLIYAILKSSIHANCRILLCLWVMSQLLVYLTVCWLSFHYIFVEQEYFSADFDPSSQRKYILTYYATCYYICTCFELGIGLERGLSILNPSKYYKSTTAYPSIVLYSLFSGVISFFIAYLALSGAQNIITAIGSILSNALDVGAFVTNFLVVIFAKRKNRKNTRELNERYQVREAYSIALAMVPAYFISSALKIGIIIANWMYVTHSVPYSVAEVMYLSFSELNCGLTSTFFLMYHVRLRAKLAWLWSGLSARSAPTEALENDTKANTDRYFGMLAQSWEKKC